MDWPNMLVYAYFKWQQRLSLNLRCMKSRDKFTNSAVLQSISLFQPQQSLHLKWRQSLCTNPDSRSVTYNRFWWKLNRFNYHTRSEARPRCRSNLESVGERNWLVSHDNWVDQARMAANLPYHKFDRALYTTHQRIAIQTPDTVMNEKSKLSQFRVSAESSSFLLLAAGSWRVFLSRFEISSCFWWSWESAASYWWHLDWQWSARLYLIRWRQCDPHPSRCGLVRSSPAGNPCRRNREWSDHRLQWLLHSLCRNRFRHFYPNNLPRHRSTTSQKYTAGRLRIWTHQNCRTCSLFRLLRPDNRGCYRIWWWMLFNWVKGWEDDGN